ncbi:hypothetical protein ABT160_38175 [Streptomyces sp. NPDC001941]|uniref:hypothetical protein n=1 Tax=Streptomyces sp. NPDC001941 TaxID=3154659 RepID=UPI0033328F66
MGYELYYEGRVFFDRPLTLEHLQGDDPANLSRFFIPLYGQPEPEGTSSGRYLTGFEVDEESCVYARSGPWNDDFEAIEEFALRHNLTLTADLRWQNDSCSPDPDEDRGYVIFDAQGQHHSVSDSSNAKNVDTHRQRTCTCYEPLTPRAPYPTSPTFGQPGTDAATQTAHALFHAVLQTARTVACDHPDDADLMAQIEEMDSPRALAALNAAALPSDLIGPIADALALLAPRSYAPPATAAESLGLVPAPALGAEATGPVVGPVTAVNEGKLTDYAVHCTTHGQIVFAAEVYVARALREAHITRHHN